MKTNTDNWCVFDTEDNSCGKFLLGWVFSPKGREFFKDSVMLRNYITSNFNVAYAHNVGYDIGNIFKDDLMVLKYSYSGSRIIKAVYSNNGRYTVFLDSMNLLPLSIAKIGDMIGKRKKTMTKKGLKWYCYRDTEILFDFISYMKGLYSRLGIDMGYTIGMNAMKYFRTICKKDLYQSEFQEQARQSYYGGRVEIFKYGNINHRIYENDINSLYPSVMKGIALPDWKRLRFVYHKNKLHKEGVSKVSVFSNLKVPLLPVRTNQGLIFPNGTFTGVYTHVELRKFLQAGGEIKKITWTVYSKETVSGIFDSYVKRLYGLRKKSDNEYERTLYKLLLNSLYGKFGYRGNREELLAYDDKTGSDNEIIFGRSRIYTLQRKKVTTGYQNPLIASYVTSYARIVLWEYLDRYHDHIIYCDTDSIFTDKKVMNTTNELGRMSFRGSYRDGQFILPKLYRAGNKLKSKGIRILGLHQWENYINKGYAYAVKPEKIKSSIRDGKTVNYWKKHRKSIVTQYGKRIVVDGGKTIPIELFY